MNEHQLAAAITARKQQLGTDLIILGHHYQTDQVIRHAHFTGDSLKLSQLAAQQADTQNARYIVFCGVHFMAESADLLTDDHIAVILPDLSAGCSMADMADYEDACDAWHTLNETLANADQPDGKPTRIIPITYVNSTAAVKAFVGMNGGACCTSSNADLIFEWALNGGETPATPDEDIKILFLPDQHLGRNTAAKHGLHTETQTALYDPKRTRNGEPLGGISAEQLARAKAILWAGHCSVHKLFRPEHCDHIRREEPDRKILVHPECAKEVVDRADLAGSTEFIINTIHNAPAGSKWAIGTEHHLVQRLSNLAAQRGIDARILSDCQCLCTTMYRIDEPHLLWILDNLAGHNDANTPKVINQVSVHPEAKKWALTALSRMLALTHTNTPRPQPATA